MIEEVYWNTGQSTSHSTYLGTQLDNRGTNDWLYNSNDEGTITPNGYDAALSVSYSGNIGSAGYAYLGFPTRPVVYLNSSVYVVSGNGTIESPYQIDMD